MIYVYSQSRQDIGQQIGQGRFILGYSLVFKDSPKKF